MFTDESDPLSFMIIMLFIYTVLIGFIFILIYNNIHGTNKLATAIDTISKSCNSNSNSKNANCIPKPTPIP
jgi:hypothetical protein